MLSRARPAMRHAAGPVTTTSVYRSLHPPSWDRGIAQLRKPLRQPPEQRRLQSADGRPPPPTHSEAPATATAWDRPPARARAAIFIDAENVSIGCIAKTLRLASGDQVLAAKAYACFASGAGGGPRGVKRLRQIGLVAVDVSRVSGKNSADIRLCIDAVNLINTMGVDKIYLATGDSDFRHLLDHAREVGVKTCLVTSMLTPTRCLAERADEVHSVTREFSPRRRREGHRPTSAAGKRC